MATVKGVWVWKDEPQFSNTSFLYETVNFYSNGVKFYRISYINDGRMSYYPDGSSTPTSVILSNRKWKSEAYKTIDFGTDGQTVTDAFYNNALLPNATQQVAGEPTTITYNGVTNELEVGKIATLACNGKKMKSDISIVFGSDGGITYNGTQTDVEAEKTATIHCGGKKMKSDLVVKT